MTVERGPIDMFLPEDNIYPPSIMGALTFTFGDQSVCIAEEIEGGVLVPRHSFSDKQLKNMGFFTIEDWVHESAPITAEFTVKTGFGLRDSQKEAWLALQKQFKVGEEDACVGGVLQLACGKGKTYLGLRLAQELKRKTIIVSPQKAHLDNWKGEIEKFFDFKGTIGLVQGQSRGWDCDIVLATIQTLARCVDKGEVIPEDIGLAIYDECHGMSALHFSKAANLFPCRRLGLSATPNRTDMNEGVFLSHLGQVFFTDVSQDLLPTVVVFDTGVFVSEADKAAFVDKSQNINLNLIRSWLAVNEDRNFWIKKKIDECLAEGRTLYVLSHSVEHIEILSKSYPGASIIHGGTKSEDRLTLLNTGKLVFATVAIGKEAYNRADLDTLFLLTPMAAHSHAAIAFEQSVGRIQRACEGKKDPKVYLFKDSEIVMSKGLTMSLVRHSKKKGYAIVYE